MNIKDTFTFGKYKGFKLIDIFQGTLNIDRKILRSYLEFLFREDSRGEYTKDMGYSWLQRIDKLKVTEQHIKAYEFVEAKYHDEGIDAYVERPVSDYDIDKYVTECNSKSENPYSLTEFNLKQKKQQIVGGDPEYVSWCIANLTDFYIPTPALSFLERTKVVAFTGLNLIEKDNACEYSPRIGLKCFTFPENLKLINESRAITARRQLGDYSDEEMEYDFDNNGVSSYGYRRWEDLDSDEGFESNAGS